MSEQGVDAIAQSEKDQLQIEVERGNLDMVKQLLERGIDPNMKGRCSRYRNALHAAVDRRFLKIVRLLLEHGADPNMPTGGPGDCILHKAACLTRTDGQEDESSLEIVKLLLKHGANPNARGESSGTALQGAAQYGSVEYGSVETVKLLLEYGANPNAQGGSYDIPLQGAAPCGPVETVKLLLEYGADPNAQGGECGNALQAAARYGSVEMVKLLLEHGADPNAQGGECGNALQAAAGTGSLESVELLLYYNADVTIQPKLANRLSLLHVAVASSKLAVIQRLCDAGGDIHLSTQDESGYTPLHVAVEKGHFAIAEYILNRGASPDIEDFGNTNSLQLAMRNQNRDMVLLLYPRTTAGLSSISASDWRHCSGYAANCSLEMISDESAKVLFRDEGLGRELDKMSYPLSSNTELPATATDFTNKHRNGKRIFILADGSMLCPEAASNVRCRWWYRRLQSRNFYHDREDWIVRASLAPTQNAVRQTSAEDCFLECALSLPCYALPEIIEDWPNDAQLEGDSPRKFESRQGIMWIMMKPRAHEIYAPSRDPVLQSRIFFSTSEYAEIPKMATDLFLPLILKVRSIWDLNYGRFQKRLGVMRTKILRSSGSDPSLIQYLLIDAKLLEILKENLTEQFQTLESFRVWYQSESARALHELPLDEVRIKMEDLNSANLELRMTIEEKLRKLTESSQNLIQLEFNLTSITEAQRSTSTNKSMKRLSWITFIFLPLLFIASLFGMNVDVLKSNPAWWWYLPIAMLTTLLTFAVWIIFKRNKSLEGNLERQFKWLFPQPKEEQDLEMGSKPGPKARRAKTASFPASGKKRS